MNLTLTEQLSYATVRIECKSKDNQLFTGTGYLFRFRIDKELNTHIPVVITNKHVIKNAYEGRIIFSKADEEGNPDDKNHFGLFLNNFEQMWKMHPSDDVDLCAMPIAPFLNQAERENHKLFYRSLDTTLIPTQEQLDDLSAMEDIVMVGYPNGIWDSINNKPIFRKGVTATHPNLDYNGKKEFMIDAAWQHDGLTELVITDSMHERKEKMASLGDAAVALPGGVGTLEELLEVITWKQLGIYTKPIVIVNVDGYYDYLIAQLQQAADELFMRPQHLKMWTVVESADQVLEAIENAHTWNENLRQYAKI